MENGRDDHANYQENHKADEFFHRSNPHFRIEHLSKSETDLDGRKMPDGISGFYTLNDSRAQSSLWEGSPFSCPLLILKLGSGLERGVREILPGPDHPAFPCHPRMGHHV